MYKRQPKDPKTARNKNVLVIGGSGSGKTRLWLKANLMQMHSSYVVTDPKGTILVECGKMLQRGAPKPCLLYTSEVLPAFYEKKKDTDADMLHPDVIVVDPPRKGCDGVCLETKMCIRDRHYCIPASRSR